MTLKRVQRLYEQLGRDDPYWAVLTEDHLRHNRWDPEELLADGVREITEAMRYLQGLGLTLGRTRALDFGCGVGRLSQALAEHFDEVVGIDISNTMIAKAEELNRHGDRCRYLVNTVGDLSLLDDAAFDFCYSNKTLQHIPSEHSADYVAEFFRLLRPGGVALFMVPSDDDHRPGWLRSLYREHLRPLFKQLRGRPPVEMHSLPQAEVLDIVRRGGAECLDVVDRRPDSRRRRLRYCAVKNA
jgi:SAM-dependent methyltransferase